MHQIEGWQDIGSDYTVTCNLALNVVLGKERRDLCGWCPIMGVDLFRRIGADRNAMSVLWTCHHRESVLSLLSFCRS